MKKEDLLKITKKSFVIAYAKEKVYRLIQNLFMDKGRRVDFDILFQEVNRVDSSAYIELFRSINLFDYKVREIVNEILKEYQRKINENRRNHHY